MTDTYHAAYWSDPSYSSLDEEEIRYSNTYQPRTKQCGIEQQRPLDSWTWEEILNGKEPWAQAGEYRRPKEELEAARAERRRYEEVARQRNRHNRQHQTFLGGGTRGVWRSLVGDLSPLLVLTGGSAVLVRHRVMWSGARCRQYALIAQCAIGQPPANAMRVWASSQGVLCRLSVSGLRYAVSAQGILLWLCVLCLRGAGRVQCVLCLRSAHAGRMWALSLRER
jgi:hypothetical protein